MAMARIAVKPATEVTEIDEYIFHIVKLYAMLKTDMVSAVPAFEQHYSEEVCQEIERDVTAGRVTKRSFKKSKQGVEFYLKGESLVWRSITIDAIAAHLTTLISIVQARGGRCTELEGVQERLPQLFREWNARGPLSPSGSREKYFHNPVQVTIGSRALSRAISATHGVISSESTEAGSTTGAPKATVTKAEAPAQAATSWCERLCCCSQPKAEEPTAASPLVSPR